MAKRMCNFKLALEVFANALLFLSGVMLLTDFSPGDWSSKRRAERESVAKLARYRRIARDPHPQPGINIDLRAKDDGGVAGLFDSPAVDVLSNVIRKNSSYANTVQWDQVVGVMCNSLLMPIGSGKTIEGLRGLSVLTLPSTATGTELEAFPMGMLDDLDKWLRASHQKSLNFWAGILLTGGFLLQLCLSFAAILAGRH